MIRVSIIVPICNVGQYVSDCLDSLVNQTLRDIEIIGIDDCSTDDSGAILDAYAKKDKRIKVIRYTENKTAAQARKDGALMAQGEYVLFVDGDDSLVVTACESLAKEMDKRQDDMIQFGTSVVASEQVTAVRKENLERMLKPYNGRIKGDEVLTACFVETRYGFQIWNKIYRLALCKEAFSHFPDGCFTKAQDAMAFFMLAFYAKSYSGLPNSNYYIYGFGRGVTGQTYLPRTSIERYAKQALVSDAIREFVKIHGHDTKGLDAWEAMDAHLFRDSMAQLQVHISDEDIAFAFDCYSSLWGADRVVADLSCKYLNEPKQWADALAGSELIKSGPRKTKCIGTYYHTLCNGGAQRVMAMLAETWVAMGYRVVLFTDGEPTPEDYEIPPGIERVVLCGYFGMIADERTVRMKQLIDAVKMNDIDMFVYHAWLSLLMFWDMLAVKSAGAQFYIQTHSVFSASFIIPLPNVLYAQLSTYALADGVMTLSRTDATFWKHFNSRVFCVTNPLTFDVDKIRPNALTNHTILWIGRLSDEKNPVQALQIFQKVLEEVPDANMLVVGSGTEQYDAHMATMVDMLHLNDSVLLCGFQTDVASFYEKASVFLSTSQYEGAPLTIAEAQCYGIPCVTYEMPYLTILESNKGSVSVAQDDKNSAARALVQLLQDKDLRNAMGKQARENIEQCNAVPIRDQWKVIVDSTAQPKAPLDLDRYERQMLLTILEHQKMRRNTGGMVGQFTKMPTKGPLKIVRKKMATVMLLLGQYGLKGATQVIGQTYSNRSKKKKA